MPSLRLDIKPALIQWALDRSGRSADDLADTLESKVEAWLSGEKKPTYKQLEDFSRAVHVPFGYLFLPEPPTENLSRLPDFRTPGSQPCSTYSLELRETIDAAKSRQQWYLEYLTEQDAQPLAFVGAYSTKNDPAVAAAEMRRLFHFEEHDRAPLETSSRDDYRNALIERFEAQRILVSIEGYVGSNTRRSLDVAEFRGFAMSDPLAPLILVNGRDWPAAQLFTLAHECAHLLLGQDALTDVDLLEMPDVSNSSMTERWCNSVAAEFLLPLAELPNTAEPQEIPTLIRRLQKRYKVSCLVVLLRLREKGLLTQQEFKRQYQTQVGVYQQWAEQGSGGSVHRTRLRKLGRRFAGAVIDSAGQQGLTYTEAYSLLGVKNDKGFDELRKRLSAT